MDENDHAAWTHYGRLNFLSSEHFDRDLKGFLVYVDCNPHIILVSVLILAVLISWKPHPKTVRVKYNLLRISLFFLHYQGMKGGPYHTLLYMLNIFIFFLCHF